MVVSCRLNGDCNMVIKHFFGIFKGSEPVGLTNFIPPVQYLRNRFSNFFQRKFRMTIYELAKQLGVAPATVSKALNGTGRMKPETRTRIIEFARQMNYHPSAVASNLRCRQTRTLGVIVPAIGAGVFSAIVRQAEQSAAARDYNIILMTTGGDVSRERDAVKMLLQRRVEGVIAAPLGPRTDLSCSHFNLLTEAGIPVVIVEQDMPGIRFPKVVVDNRGGARKITEYLLQLGHRRILMPVHSTEPWNRSGIERVNGYREAFRDCGLTPDPALVVPFDRARLPEWAAAVKRGDFTAIFAICDAMAMEIISYLASAGLRVPADLSVGGFDNMEYSGLLLPALTTVNQPMDRLGQQAVAMLFEMIAARDPFRFDRRTVTVACDLVIRNSCANYRKFPLN